MLSYAPRLWRSMIGSPCGLAHLVLLLYTRRILSKLRCRLLGGQDAETTFASHSLFRKLVVRREPSWMCGLRGFTVGCRLAERVHLFVSRNRPSVVHRAESDTDRSASDLVASAAPSNLSHQAGPWTHLDALFVHVVHQIHRAKRSSLSCDADVRCRLRLRTELPRRRCPS